MRNDDFFKKQREIFNLEKENYLKHLDELQSGSKNLELAGIKEQANNLYEGIENDGNKTKLNYYDIDDLMKSCFEHNNKRISGSKIIDEDKKIGNCSYITPAMEELKKHDKSIAHLLFWLLIALSKSYFAEKISEDECKKYYEEERENVVCCALYLGIEIEEFKEYICAVNKFLNYSIDVIPEYKSGRTKIFNRFNSAIALSDNGWRADEIDLHTEYVERFCSYFKAKIETIIVDTIEEKEAMKVISDAVNALYKDNNRIYEWNVARGLFRQDNGDILQEKGSLEDALSYIMSEATKDESSNDTEVFVLRTIEGYIGNSVITGMLKVITESIQIKKSGQMYVILIGRNLEIDSSIEKYVFLEDGIGYPNRHAIKEIISNFMKDNKSNIDETNIEQLAVACKGLTRNEIDRVLRLSYAKNNSNQSIKEIESFINAEKKQIIKKSSLVEIIDVDPKLEVGGLKALNKWLDEKKNIIFDTLEAEKNYVNLPKGVLLIGMPGCGKSLSAKYTSIKFNKPLIKIDMGSLMNKYVGESEHNFRDALKLAEAISPCILWIDELEKAFPGGKDNGNQSESSSRILAHLLTWMQEKKTMTFVVATANNVKSLPPELLRRGRFDETFFVDLPTEEEICDIFQLHLHKRNLNIPSDVVKNMAKEMRSKNFSGSDVEYTVRSIAEKRYNAIRKNAPGEVSEKLIKDSINEITSLAESMEEELKPLNKYKKKFRNAASEE